jgi:hypothetical protein
MASPEESTKASAAKTIAADRRKTGFIGYPHQTAVLTRDAGRRPPSAWLRECASAGRTGGAILAEAEGRLLLHINDLGKLQLQRVDPGGRPYCRVI